MTPNEPSSPSTTPEQIKDLLIIKDSDLALTVLHEKKKMILSLLLHDALTIQNLTKKTGMNPGTIKRHLLDLMKHDLIFVEKEARTDYNIKMKFYRARAKRLRIEIEVN
ncbi:MAG: winged helix-turn-helix domain-containing protein [Promethearchaeota archaeon]